MGCNAAAPQRGSMQCSRHLPKGEMALKGTLHCRAHTHMHAHKHTHLLGQSTVRATSKLRLGCCDSALPKPAHRPRNCLKDLTMHVHTHARACCAAHHAHRQPAEASESTPPVKRGLRDAASWHFTPQAQLLGRHTCVHAQSHTAPAGRPIQ